MNKNKKKMSLNRKISIWFAVLIIISLVLYALIMFAVLRFTAAANKPLEILKVHPEIGQKFLEQIAEINRGHRGALFIPAINVVPAETVLRFIFVISSGVILIVIIAVTGGIMFLRRTLSQVNRITNNVKEIDEKKLHLRLNMEGDDAISRMANTFDEMLDKLENSFNQQKQFIQNASHELNTPLTIIKTNIDVLEQNKNATKEDYEEMVGLINREVIRLSRMTDDLMTLSKLDEYAGDKKFTEVDIKTEIDRVSGLFENNMAAKDMALKKDYQSTITINAIAGHMQQLVFNLLDNAVKYAEHGSEVVLKTYDSEDKENLVMELENKTAVINAGDIPHIFNRFYKRSGADTGVYAGTDNGTDITRGFGLGLAICKKIIENHKGSIDVEFDEPTSRISFKVLLPAFT